MADLNHKEKRLFEKLFNRGGYVLDFSNRSFEDFFNDFNIQIFSNKYEKHGNSKFKRLHAFWDIELNTTVGLVLNELLQYAKSMNKIDNDDLSNATSIIDRLKGNANHTVHEITINNFLQKEINEIPLESLLFDEAVTYVLKQRFLEIEKCLSKDASLAAIFLIGSSLEGILLGIATKHPKKYNQSKSAPKDKESNTLPLRSWTLNSFIDVAHEVGHLKTDIKKFSHVLRDFRNYIHPYEQVSSKFNPDKNTALICWQVLKAAVLQLSKIST